MRPSTLKNALAGGAAWAELDPACRALVSKREAVGCEADYLAVLEQLLARAPLKQLDAADVLGSAKARMEVAARLAELPVTVAAPAALAACAWLDVGKIFLDVASEQGFAWSADAPGTAAANALEAESARFGADHALAGKWLAEHWRLPVVVCEAIWLHHHSLTTIELAAESPGLCYFVMLADVLSEFRGEAPAQLSPYADELCRRVGLRPKEALAAARPGARSATQKVHSTEPASFTAEDQFRALCAMHEGLTRAEDSGEVLVLLANALREALRCPRGAVRAQHAYAAWDGDAPVLQSAGESGKVPAVRAGQRAVALPMTSAGKDFGHAWMALPGGDTRNASEQVQDIARVLDAGAAALARLERHAALDARGEALAAALNRIETERQQAVLADRLGGLAQFAAGAAHEINNPLTVISGRAQLLLSQSPNAAQAGALEAIVQQSQRIGKIVSDLMQFARPPEPSWSVADIADIIDPLIAPIRERIASRRGAFTTHYAAGLPRVRIDRHQMEQAIAQGLLNAEQALKESGGAILLAVRASADREAVEIEIRDNGTGISAEDLARVFDPFFTTKQFADGGTGLGLTVCRSIMESHGGQVSIASRMGEGTVLTLRLPAAKTGTVDAPKTATAPVAARKAVAPREIPRVMTPVDFEDAQAAELGIVESTPAPKVATLEEDAAVRETAAVEETVAAPAEVSPEAAAQAEAIVERVFPRIVQTRPPAGPPAIVPAQGRILLIEENEDLREILRAALASRGYETETAPDGLEGLASALAHPGELIVCSTQLTGVDAVTLVKQVRQRNPKLPIIALAGPGPDEAAPEILRAGARVLLHKPFDFDRLLQEITQFLQARNVA